MNAPWRSLVAAVVIACAIAGCAAGPDSEPASPEVRAQTLVEEGNKAYESGDYRLAARRYAAAAVVRKDDPAAYYGLGMALSKLGRDEEARTAYARAKALTREPPASGPGDAQQTP